MANGTKECTLQGEQLRSVANACEWVLTQAYGNRSYNEVIGDINTELGDKLEEPTQESIIKDLSSFLDEIKEGLGQ